MDHHDGGHDGALRYSYGPYLRLHRPKSGSRRQFIGFHRSFRGRLYGCLQPLCARRNDSSVGVRSNGSALADDDEQQHYSRWTALASRGRLPANTVQRRLSATLSLSNSVPRLPLETRGVGAFQMGIEHGSFCLGCCWVLMALLFFGGVMNLWWIVGLTLFVLLEKILPFGALAGRMIGAIVAVCGLLVLVRQVS